MIHLLSNIIYDGCTHARPQRKLALQKNSKATTLDDLKCAALQFLGAPLQMFARHSYDTLPKRQNSWNTVIPNTGDRSQVMPISAQPVEWMWQLALKCKHHPERTINKLQGGWAHHQLETLTRRPASDKTYINGWRVVRAHGDGPVRQASSLHQHGNDVQTAGAPAVTWETPADGCQLRERHQNKVTKGSVQCETTAAVYFSPYSTLR